MRDRKKKQTKLHLLYQDSTKNVETEMAVPEPFTEIIGWHAGNEVVGLKKTPEC
jgi:L-rhamnose isomerase